MSNIFQETQVLFFFLLQLNAKEKSLEKLKEDESDFIQLRDLYYQSIDTKKFDFDNTLWRQHVSSLCADLAVTWAKDQPSNATEAEASPFADSSGGSGKSEWKKFFLLGALFLWGRSFAVSVMSSLFIKTAPEFLLALARKSAHTDENENGNRVASNFMTGKVQSSRISFLPKF